MNDDPLDKKVKRLYDKDKVFKELFDFMFVEWGWAATEINKDVMRIYKIVKKYKKGVGHKKKHPTI